MAGRLTKFVERMRYWCDQGNLGYDQGNRWDIRVGGECDCSSLVIFALKEAGFDTGSASYTGNMSENLTKRGWQRLSPNVAKKVGDILLNDSHHVAAVTGNNLMSYASIDERGRASGGQSGDQTGKETKTVSGFYYVNGWRCILRYTGSGSAAVQVPVSNTSSNTLSTGSTGSKVTWLQNQLIEMGYSLPKYGADGSFGSETTEAVKAFQRHYKLEVDGIAGPKTLAAVNKYGVDGAWGTGTTQLLQWRFGTPDDGIVSGQIGSNSKYYPAASTSSWEWNNGSGSTVIKALQKYLGVSADGWAGHDTAVALQKYLGVSADGYVGAETTKELQRCLNRNTF